jgi:hypothetical protein
VLRRGGDEAAKSDLEWKAEQKDLSDWRCSSDSTTNERGQRAEGRKPQRGKERTMGHLYWARLEGELTGPISLPTP